MIKDIQPGDPLKADDWQAIDDGVAANRLIAGRNVRLAKSPNGTRVHFIGGGASFNHPHKCDLQGNTCQINPGLINKKLPLNNGEEVVEPFSIKFSPSYDAEGRAWIVAKIRFKDDWSVEYWTYEFTPKPFAGDSNPGIGGYDTLDDGTVNVPILFIKNIKGRIISIQHVIHNLEVRTRPGGAASGKARHLAYAAG